MCYSRLRTLALAVATIGTAMFGVSSPAVADILVGVTDGTSPTVYYDAASNVLAVVEFTAGSYTGAVDVQTTNYPGAGGQGQISTTVNVTQVTASPAETLSISVQLVASNLGASSTNILWNNPAGTPVTASAAASLAASGDTGTVTTTTYYASTSSLATTGLGANVISATSSPGNTSGNLANPATTYTLSQTVVLTGFTIGAGPPPGTNAPTFGGTSSIVGPALAAVPEPSSLAIAGIGALGMIGFGLRRRKAMGA